MTTITKEKHKNTSLPHLSAEAIGRALAPWFKACKRLWNGIIGWSIRCHRRRIRQIDEALVWEIKQGMSKEHFIQANKQVAQIKQKLYHRIACLEKRLKQ